MEPRAKDGDLPDVRVPPVLVHREHGGLEKMRPVDDVSVEAYGLPAARLLHFEACDLLQLMERVPGADRDARRGVALVELVVEEEADLCHRHLLLELHVDEVRLLPVALPVRFSLSAEQRAREEIDVSEEKERNGAHLRRERKRGEGERERASGFGDDSDGGVRMRRERRAQQQPTRQTAPPHRRSLLALSTTGPTLLSRSCSTPLPDFAVESDQTASMPISR